MATRTRFTTRKAIIEEIFARDYSGGPVLLEELRWKVFVEQYGPNFIEMTVAQRGSFARTIREHSPGLTIHKVAIDSETPVGLVARSAVYRLTNRDQLQQFINGDDPCILCRYQTNVEVFEPRYHSGNRYVAAAAVPWKLFGYYQLNDWHQVAPTDGLGAVIRNRLG